jgi:hypothetical protein
VINGGADEAGFAPRVVFQSAGGYVGRGRRFACLRCVCLATAEDFLAFVGCDEAGEPLVDLLDCPACGYAHQAVTAESALASELIDREEFEFLCSPLDLALEAAGNDTLRVKRS